VLLYGEWRVQHTLVIQLLAIDAKPASYYGNLTLVLTGDVMDQEPAVKHADEMAYTVKSRPPAKPQYCTENLARQV
jgi:hypothetical protein